MYIYTNPYNFQCITPLFFCLENSQLDYKWNFYLGLQRNLIYMNKCNQLSEYFTNVDIFL